MRAEEVADRPRFSVTTRYESLVGVSNVIGTHRDPKELFSIQRSGWDVEFRRISGAAHLRRGKNSFRRETFRGSAAGNTTDLPADRPAGLSWGLGRTSRIPQRQGVPRAAGATRGFR